MLKLEELNLGKIRPFLIPGLIVFGIVFSGFVLLRPRIENIFRVQQQLSQKQKKLEQLTAKINALEGLDEFELSSRADLVGRAFPAEKDFPLFLSILKKLIAGNNLETTSLQVDPGEIATVSAQPQKGPPVLLFTVKVRGQMSDLKEFLVRISRIAPLMMVRDVKVKIDEGGIADVSLLVDAPFQALPASLGKVEKPLAQITTEEDEVYQKLTRLDFSLFKEGVFISVPSGKEDPFSF